VRPEPSPFAFRSAFVASRLFFNEVFVGTALCRFFFVSRPGGLSLVFFFSFPAIVSFPSIFFDDTQVNLVKRRCVGFFFQRLRHRLFDFCLQRATGRPSGGTFAVLRTVPFFPQDKCRLLAPFLFFFGMTSFRSDTLPRAEQHAVVVPEQGSSTGVSPSAVQVIVGSSFFPPLHPSE